MSLKNKASKPDCYHLDTCYLIELLNHPKTDLSRTASQAMEYLGRHNLAAEISEIAVGEFIKVAIRDRFRESIIMDFVHRGEQEHFRICPIRNLDILLFSELVAEIRKEESWIEPTDVLIIAQSMATTNCVGLLTFEDKLIHNGMLQNIRDTTLKEKENFVISHYPR